MLPLAPERRCRLGAARERRPAWQGAVGLRLVAPLAMVLGGCYGYVPRSSGELIVGSEVRVQLSHDAARRIEEQFGGERRYLTGALEGWGEQVLLVVPIAFGESPARRALRQRVVLSRSEILALDARVLDRRRTTLFAAGTVTGVAVILTKLLAGLSGGGEGNVPGDPLVEEARVPFLTQHGR